MDLRHDTPLQQSTIKARVLTPGLQGSPLGNSVNCIIYSYKKLLEENIGNVQGNDDPLSKSFVKMMDMFEDSTGLNLNNILFNSLKILGTD